MADRLLTPTETAAYLQVAPHTLAVWRCKGIGPPYRKVGSRLVRYAQGDLEAWLARQPQEPRPEPKPLTPRASTGRLVLTLPVARRRHSS